MQNNAFTFSVPGTYSPSLRPATSSPSLRPATFSPSLRPATSSPSLRPAISSPSFRPATSSPSLHPATSSPSLRPAASSPSLRPTSSGTSSWGRTSTDPTPCTTSYSPAASKAGQSRNWRANAGPLPPPPPPRPECIPGRVVKLPEEQEVPVISRVHKDAASFGQPWNHPFVITEEWRDENGVRLAKIRCCTSWGGQGIVAKQWYHRRYFVVADQTTLASGKFDRPTYVNCSPGQELTIEFEYLQLWAGKPIQFQQRALDSFNKNEPRPRRDSGVGC
ncbi:uncharacterized protein M421DRAFT_5147 [Didymella exigua CBS 183.55]|uniref:Uncharacterized protein n=1 Tax=Didymella exigua CBS 183.55 TaxID=1150837 RepID=A0A6A5RJV9_9PLEO|nr:uncharacterized protein M421DRAFT_5147 [Didymella exigua CBS 183.55]KAF1928691.1 hypothetical protein M421DRAFT_5147 [Didymella exigua CBS 183.55]